MECKEIYILSKVKSNEANPEYRSLKEYLKWIIKIDESWKLEFIQIAINTVSQTYFQKVLKAIIVPFIWPNN